MSGVLLMAYNKTLSLGNPQKLYDVSVVKKPFPFDKNGQGLYMCINCDLLPARCFLNVYIVCYYDVMSDFQSKCTLFSLPKCQATFCSKQVSCVKFK